MKNCINEATLILTDSLVEAALSPEQRAELSDLISDLYDVSDPMYVDDGRGYDDDVIEKIRKKFGNHIADTAGSGTHRMHFGRDTHNRDALKRDALKDKEAAARQRRFNKDGKMNKRDVEFEKLAIKRRLGLI